LIYSITFCSFGAKVKSSNIACSKQSVSLDNLYASDG
jgi:hypothetical protein